MAEPVFPFTFGNGRTATSGFLKHKYQITKEFFSFCQIILFNFLKSWINSRNNGECSELGDGYKEL